LQFCLANEVHKPSVDKLTQRKAYRLGIASDDFHQVLNEPLLLTQVRCHDKHHELASLSAIERQNLLNQFNFHDALCLSTEYHQSACQCEISPPVLTLT
jgi:hypothetical protein